MKRFLFLIPLVLASMLSVAQVHVRGYYRSNGTYVQPHERTRPNHTVTDNYSYPGNYNPNTGKTTGESSGSLPSTTPASTRSTYSVSPSRVSVQPEPSEQVPTLTSPAIVESVSAPLYVETDTDAALKVEPSYTAKSIYAIPKGASVKVTRYSQYYYLAEVNGRSGYLCSCQVKKTFTSASF